MVKQDYVVLNQFLKTLPGTVTFHQNPQDREQEKNTNLLLVD